MHLLVIGQTGQLARALAAEVDNREITAEFINRQTCDLSWTADIIYQVIGRPMARADCVIIAAAYTDVDAAEADYDTALAINGIAPGVIANAAAKVGAPVVHISSDYVFEGNERTPYRPDHPLNPLNNYGRSKAKGEQAVLSAQPNATILRTSWVYDGRGKNFLTTMLRLAETHDALAVVDDQIGRPTYATDLAQATLCAARHLVEGHQAASGIFHVSNTGAPISWADFATEIFTAAGKATTVVGVSASEYPTAAQRPAYSVMDISKFETVFSIALPHWKLGLTRALKQRTSCIKSKDM